MKSIVTIDHISAGRAMLGLGGAWFELGAPRLRASTSGRASGSGWTGWREAVPAARALLDGETVTSAPGGRYAFDDLRILPPPVQAHLPIVIGGSGERKTLRIVARWADMWNAFGSPDELAAKDAILRAHCADVGRDPATIERSVGCKVTIRSTLAEARARRRAVARPQPARRARCRHRPTFWTGTPETVAETMLAYRRIGFGTFIVELPAPYDLETMTTLIEVVRPMVEAA